MSAKQLGTTNLNCSLEEEESLLEASEGEGAERKGDMVDEELEPNLKMVSAPAAQLTSGTSVGMGFAEGLSLPVSLGWKEIIVICVTH